MPPQVTPHMVIQALLFWGTDFRCFRFTLCFPFPELPLPFFTLIIGENVRKDALGDVLDLMLRDARIVDELLFASQICCFTSGSTRFSGCWFTVDYVIGWHGSFPRRNRKCRHQPSKNSLCVCIISISLYASIIPDSAKPVKQVRVYLRGV